MLCPERWTHDLCPAGDCRGHPVPPHKQVQPQGLEMYIVSSAVEASQMTSERLRGSINHDCPIKQASPAGQARHLQVMRVYHRLMVRSACLGELNETWPVLRKPVRQVQRWMYETMSGQGGSLLD